jgi:hypothetical protein
MDYARDPSTHESARRPAAEPGAARSAAPAMIDLRRGATTQRMAMAGAAVAQLAAPEEELQMKRHPSVAQLAAPEEELQMKQAPGVAQLAAPEEELQMKQAAPATAQRAEVSAAPSGSSGLPMGLRSGIESLSGLSLDGVNVHYNSSQPAQLNALAYAQGRDIHLAPGQEAHLPHEAWHVVQQAQGRVEPTMQLKDGVSINDNAGLENEADIMGEKALALGA